jgi:TolB-like protein/Tfp pilus assembly protein PilF
MPDDTTASGGGSRGSRDQLDSWGEIAGYLHRSISTVQRWERSEGLPVRRIAHARLGSIYAKVGELDAWYEARSRAPAPEGAPSAAGRVTLAVLPFQNLSGDAEQDYLSDGLTEELITQLARLRPDRLAVIARTSAMQYRNVARDVRAIGAELGAAYLLEGSVRRGGDAVRVTAQLVAAGDGTNLWADSYEQPLTDVVEIQSAIAERVGDSLSIHLLSEQHAAHARARHTTPEALEEYFRGRYFWFTHNPDGFARSFACFQRAIALDPGYAPAHAGLADAYAAFGFWAHGMKPPKEMYPLARASAERALALDPGLAEAYATLGFVQFQFDWDWAAAERSFARALELNPSYATGHQWYSLYLALQGRIAEALAENTRARALDPHAMVLVDGSIGWVYYFGREYDKAREHLSRTLEMNPNLPLTRMLLASVHCFSGRFDEALDEHDAFDRRHGPRAVGITLRACHLARAGRRAEAEEALARLKRGDASSAVFSWHVAMVQANLGHTDEAFAELERVYAEHSDALAYLRAEPHWDPLRSDPRFDDLLRRVNLA